MIARPGVVLTRRIEQATAFDSDAVAVALATLPPLRDPGVDGGNVPRAPWARHARMSGVENEPARIRQTMCTFNHEAAVAVCDVAIDSVRADLEAVFPGAVRFTHFEGAGTLVEPESDLEPAQFGTVIKAAIARAQLVPRDDPASPK